MHSKPLALTLLPPWRSIYKIAIYHLLNSIPFLSWRFIGHNLYVCHNSFHGLNNIKQRHSWRFTFIIKKKYLLELLLFDKVILTTVLLALARIASSKADAEFEQLWVFSKHFLDECTLRLYWLVIPCRHLNILRWLRVCIGFRWLNLVRFWFVDSPFFTKLKI